MGFITRRKCAERHLNWRWERYVSYRDSLDEEDQRYANRLLVEYSTAKDVVFGIGYDVSRNGLGKHKVTRRRFPRFDWYYNQQ